MTVTNKEAEKFDEQIEKLDEEWYEKEGMEFAQYH